MFFKTRINVFIFLTVFFNTTFAKDAYGTYINFNVIGAQFTSAQSINESGMITGNYGLTTSPHVTHGFIRMPNGKITKFSVSGGNFTYPVSINNAGTVTGTVRSDMDDMDDCYYTSYCKSFVRTLDGKITTFSVPEAEGGTIAVGINNSGTITGFAHEGDETKGFVRQANGTIITFDVPGAKYTRPASINNDGVITGCYNVISTVGTLCSSAKGGHGFIRMTDGTFITFDVPGIQLLTSPTDINDLGEITGFYENDLSNDDFGVFLRKTDGSILKFNVPNEGLDTVFKINNDGVILGNYFTINGPRLHAGFTREPSGEIREWKHPATDANYTRINDINEAGMVVGEYLDYKARKSYSFLLNTKINNN